MPQSVTTRYYSAAHRESLRELTETHLRNPDPLNMLEEFALARAVFETFVARVTAESLTAEVAAVAIRLLSNITCIAKRIEDVRAQDAINRHDLVRVMELMGRAVNDVIDRQIAARSPSALCEDAEAVAMRIKEDIRNRWMEIQLD
ncbi:MAG: hypothetical protein H6Q33_339 [Deltaproteobacteria bacterium]|nr:hypothetical protein [Deltaproteobacteria bacterium]